MNAHQRRVIDRQIHRKRCGCGQKLSRYESPCMADHPGKCCDCVDESAGTQFRVLNRLRARESEAAGAGKAGAA